MSTQNIGFLEKNAQRAYPLEENSSGMASNSELLPTGILVDLNLRYNNLPLDAGAYVGSVRNTPKLISVSISKADSIAEPLATVSLPKPVNIYQNYRMESLANGAIGWVVFGPAVEHGPYGTWRFDNPDNSLLRRRCARPLTDYGVTSIRENSKKNTLQGIVNLQNRSDGSLKIRETTRTIDGQSRSVIAIGLDIQQGGTGLLKRLTGPCGGVPESDTCTRPEIRSINGVVPDCNGVVKLRIEEEVDASLGELFTLQDTGGTPSIRIDSAIGLEQTCDRPEVNSLLDQVDLCDTFDLDTPNT